MKRIYLYDEFDISAIEIIALDLFSINQFNMKKTKDLRNLLFKEEDKFKNFV